MAKETHFTPEECRLMIQALEVKKGEITILIEKLNGGNGYPEFDGQGDPPEKEKRTRRTSEEKAAAGAPSRAKGKQGPKTAEEKKAARLKTLKESKETANTRRLGEMRQEGDPDLAVLEGEEEE